MMFSFFFYSCSRLVLADKQLHTTSTALKKRTARVEGGEQHVNKYFELRSVARNQVYKCSRTPCLAYILLGIMHSSQKKTLENFSEGSFSFSGEN